MESLAWAQATPGRDWKQQRLHKMSLALPGPGTCDRFHGMTHNKLPTFTPVVHVTSLPKSQLRIFPERESWSFPPETMATVVLLQRSLRHTNSGVQSPHLNAALQLSCKGQRTVKHKHVGVGARRASLYASVSRRNS